MRGAGSIVLTCVECGEDFRVPPTRAKTATTCSNECGYKRRGKTRRRQVTIQCAHCSQSYSVPQCHADRRVYCSVRCQEAAPGTIARKASRRGEANGAWKGGVAVHSDGYRYELESDHPMAHPTGYLLQHRLVMERWLIENEPESPFLVTVDGRLVLSPNQEVHHKNEIRDDNRIENLQCMTKAEHRRHHNEVIAKALAFYRLHHPQGE